MAARALVALALLELEDDLLVTLVLIDNLSRDLGLGKSARIRDDIGAVVEEEHVEGDLVAGLAFDLLNVEHIARLYGVLLATCFDNRVHVRTFHYSLTCPFRAGKGKEPSRGGKR